MITQIKEEILRIRNSVGLHSLIIHKPYLLESVVTAGRNPLVKFSRSKFNRDFFVIATLLKILYKYIVIFFIWYNPKINKKLSAVH